MFKTLRANITNNLIYYKRKHIITAMLLFIVMVLFPFMLYSWPRFAQKDYFEAVSILINGLMKFGHLIAPILCAFFIYTYHTKKHLKMVFTKPCSPEQWLFSAIISSLLVTLAIYLFTMLLGVILLISFGLPIQAGFFYSLLYYFFTTVIMTTFTAFLVVLFTKSGLAIIFFMFVGAKQFLNLRDLLHQSIARGEFKGFSKVLFTGIKHLTDLFYWISPIKQPYIKNINPVFVSYRAMPVYWKYLFFTFLYTLIVFGVYFILSVFILKKRRHI